MCQYWLSVTMGDGASVSRLVDPELLVPSSSIVVLVSHTLTTLFGPVLCGINLLYESVARRLSE